jgi:hypothetical protein
MFSFIPCNLVVAGLTYSQLYIGMGYLVDQLFFPEQDTGKAM